MYVNDSDEPRGTLAYVDNFPAEAAAELDALRARVAELEAAVRALRDAAEASDDSLYGTLGTGFVRSVVDGALGLSPTLALTKRDGHCLRCGSRAR